MEKSCNICGREIKVKQENYSMIVDYVRDKEIRKIYVHDACFKNRFENMIKLDKIGRRLFNPTTW